MKKYKCIKELYLEKYDDEGFSTAKYMTIPKDSIWVTDDVIPQIGHKDCVHLDRVWKSKNAKTHPFIEILPETLNEYFVLIS